LVEPPVLAAISGRDEIPLNLAKSAFACNRVSGMHLSGVAVRVDQVQLLAGLLGGDDLAVKLRLALKNRNDLVGLSTADRARIVHVCPTRRLPV
jgi:hypothetical protein